MEMTVHCGTDPLLWISHSFVELTFLYYYFFAHNGKKSSLFITYVVRLGKFATTLSMTAAEK